MWDYDEAGTHILIDGQVAGQPRKLITHSARNGFLYTFERTNGQTVLAKPYVENINWTKGIDQKTGKPVDYDPKQGHPGLFRAGRTRRWPSRTKKLCPSMPGGNNYWPSSYSPKTKLLYIPSLIACNEVDARSGAVTTRQATGRARRSGTSSATRPTSSSPIRSPARSRSSVHMPYPELQRRARDRRRPGLHRLHRRHVRRPMTTPRSSSCGRSMSAPASTRRR